MISRRGFLSSLAAVGVAPFVPWPAPVERVPLSMVRLARAAMDAESLRDRQLGISIRFVQRWDLQSDTFIHGLES